MKILSIHWGSTLCSGASLLVDNELIAVVQEERYSRIKNDDSFPSNSIDYCLKKAGITTSQLDGVAIASKRGCLDYYLTDKPTWKIQDYIDEQHKRWKPFLVDKTIKHKTPISKVFPEKINLNKYPSEYFHNLLKDRSIEESIEQFSVDREKIVANYLNIDVNKVRRIDHHRCHAYWSYYTSKFRDEKVLSFVADGLGEEYNGTIAVFDEKGDYHVKFETDLCNLARFYRYMTLLLGMKPNEHEYKMMGMAPYGKEKYAQKALEILRDTLYVDGIEFKYKDKISDHYFYFKDKFEGIRFDTISYAIQKYLEEILEQWVENAVNKFGINKIIFSGGVGMNIKAMGKLLDLPFIESVSVGGSCSDESMAISAGICLLEDLEKESGSDWNSSCIERLEALYLGPDTFEDIDEDSFLNKINNEEYEIIRNISNEAIAQLLSKGKIIGRCVGRMEFGARALCNRSIIADPTNADVKERINSAIKCRDFWMPFAPVVMDKYVNKYLINKKMIDSPHMTIGFQTTKLGFDSMKAACHPSDRSARPQIINRKTNLKMYELLESFEKITGRGALLNTSFNLHGYPIVNTALDAIHVFKNSDLRYLILNDTMIIKK